MPTQSCKCLTCGCNDFTPNPFKVSRCINCMHNHAQKPGRTATTPAARTSALPPRPQAPKEKTVKTDKPSSSGSTSGGLLSRMFRSKKKDDEETVTITHPTEFKRVAHVGANEHGQDDGMAALPPDLQALVDQINAKLMEQGHKAMTPYEAFQLLKNKDALLGLQEKLENKPQQPSTRVQQTNEKKPPAIARPSTAPPKRNPLVPTQPASTAQPRFPKFCTACGNSLQQGDKFCTKCGKKIIVATQTCATTTPTRPQQTIVPEVKPKETSVPVSPKRSATQESKGNGFGQKPQLSKSALTTRNPGSTGRPTQAPLRQDKSKQEHLVQLRAVIQEQESQITRLQRENNELLELKDAVASLRKELDAEKQKNKALEGEITKLKQRPSSVERATPTWKTPQKTIPSTQTPTNTEEIAELRKRLEIESSATAAAKKQLADEIAAAQEARKKTEVAEKEKSVLKGTVKTLELKVQELETTIRVRTAQAQEEDKQKEQFESELKALQKKYEDELKQAREAGMKDGEKNMTEKLTPELEMQKRENERLKQELCAAKEAQKNLDTTNQRLRSELESAKKPSQNMDKEIEQARKEWEKQLEACKAANEDAIRKLKEAHKRDLADVDQKISDKNKQISQLEDEVEHLIEERSKQPTSSTAAPLAPPTPAAGTPAPPPPPPPPPPPSTSQTPLTSPVGTAGSSTRGDLLDSIRSGTTLKHVSDESKKKQGGSGDKLGGNDLVSVLAKALICRRAETRNDEDSDDEDNEWEEKGDSDD